MDRICLRGELREVLGELVIPQAKQGPAKQGRKRIIEGPALLVRVLLCLCARKRPGTTFKLVYIVYIYEQSTRRSGPATQNTMKVCRLPSFVIGNISSMYCCLLGCCTAVSIDIIRSWGIIRARCRVQNHLYIRCGTRYQFRATCAKNQTSNIRLF